MSRTSLSSIENPSTGTHDINGQFWQSARIALVLAACCFRRATFSRVNGDSEPLSRGARQDGGARLSELLSRSRGQAHLLEIQWHSRPEEHVVDGNEHWSSSNRTLTESVCPYWFSSTFSLAAIYDGDLGSSRDCSSRHRERIKRCFTAVR